MAKSKVKRIAKATGAALFQRQVEAWLRDGVVTNDEANRILSLYATGNKILQEQGTALLQGTNIALTDVKAALRDIAGQSGTIVREITSGLREAGAGAVEELSRRGRDAFLSEQVAEVEDALFAWAAKTTPKVTKRLTRMLFWFGGLLILLAVTTAGFLIPPVRVVALIALGALLLVWGVVVLRDAFALRKESKAWAAELERLAAMPRLERHEALRRRPPAAP